MKKQMSIRLEEEDIRKLKIYAIQHHTTVQAIAEDYLTGLIKEEERMENEKTGMNILWYNDNGEYYKVYEVLSAKAMSVDEILQFSGLTLEKIAEKLGFDSADYEALTTER